MPSSPCGIPGAAAPPGWSPRSSGQAGSPPLRELERGCQERWQVQKRTLAGRTPGATDPAGMGPGVSQARSAPFLTAHSLHHPLGMQTLSGREGVSPGGQRWGRGAARVPLAQGRPPQQPCAPPPRVGGCAGSSASLWEYSL